MSFLKRHKVLVSFLLLLIVGGGVYALTHKPKAPEWVTGSIDRGIVRELVSVSGVVEAGAEATLTFPASGIVRDIRVKEGDRVAAGTLLALLEHNELLAERSEASALLMVAEADLTELKNGPRSEERAITASDVSSAQNELARTISEERVKVENAYRALLSNDLEAVPLNTNSNAQAPTITGTYTCSKEGVYHIEFFRSAAFSGFSYRLSGLESGSETAFSESSSPFGTCGLRMQIDSDANYGNGNWTVAVPNTKSATYPTLLNAYLLAQETEKNAVKAAQDALTKTEREATLSNATPREEALARASARVAERRANLASIDARIGDRTLKAPFDGTVSAVDITLGEVSSDRSITLVTENAFMLTIRIPEIDITKVQVGQHAEVVFDAAPTEKITGSVAFISPLAREIDGVAYFEADITFPNPPSWMRSGLNADVDIIVAQSNEGLRVPKRFLKTDNNAAYLLYPDGITTRQEKVDVLFTGNDGFVSISGNIREGETIVAP